MLLPLMAACTSPPPPAPPPDVLVVVIDTLRADALSAYGNPRETTPQIDALAAAGVLFTDVTSPASWTWPGHASLFTGVPQWVNGARTRSGAAETGGSALASYAPMRQDLPTLAGRFSAAGYHTTSLSENSWLDPDLGLVRGFDRAEVRKDGCGPLWDAAVQTAEGRSNQPLFMFINMMLPHAPWGISPSPWSQPHAAIIDAPPPWAAPFISPERRLDLYQPLGPGQPSGFQAHMSGQRPIPDSGLAVIRDLYEGEVAAADYCFHRGLTQWLERRPGSIVVLTSDHGEYLGER
ncbi:MAG: sulfatase-like hydrolase/transferase, partial [Myxococcota bacterium]|nr:sulfatase-like hydrolase/transferase [Myxococcota bacterium]